MNNKLFPLSIIILTHRNDEIFFHSLKSAQWSNDVIIVDSSSQNNWNKLQREFHFSIVKSGTIENFSSVRNEAMKKAKNDWIFFLDSDEVIGKELKKEIQENLNLVRVNGLDVQRQDFFLQQALHHGEVGNIKLLRLTRKKSGQWQGKVHEKFILKNQKVGHLKSPLYHYPHQSIHSFVAKVNDYTTIRAKELNDQHIKFSSFEMILKPIAKFIWNYFFKFGFLDGWRGLIYASAMSLHSLTVRIKLYEKA